MKPTFMQPTRNSQKLTFFLALLQWMHVLCNGTLSCHFRYLFSHLRIKVTLLFGSITKDVCLWFKGVSFHFRGEG
jgi:hypothetical protein